MGNSRLCSLLAQTSPRQIIGLFTRGLCNSCQTWAWPSCWDPQFPPLVLTVLSLRSRKRSCFQYISGYRSTQWTYVWVITWLINSVSSMTEMGKFTLSWLCWRVKFRNTALLPGTQHLIFALNTCSRHLSAFFNPFPLIAGCCFQS